MAQEDLGTLQDNVDWSSGYCDVRVEQAKIGTATHCMRLSVLQRTCGGHPSALRMARKWKPHSGMVHENCHNTIDLSL